MVAVDEGISPLSERELLLLVNEKLNALSIKFDEFKMDQAGKYQCICEDVKAFKDQHNEDMRMVNKTLDTYDGAIKIIEFIILCLSGLIVYIITKFI